MSRFHEFEYMTSAFPKRLNLNGEVYFQHALRFRRRWREAVKEAYHIKNRFIKCGVRSKIMKGKLYVYVFVHEKEYNQFLLDFEGLS